jgi:hypothetical protein
VYGENDIKITVDADNRTGPAFEAAQKNAKAVGDASDKAGKLVAKLGEQSEAAAIKARKLAEAEERSAAKARELGEKLVVLRRQLSESGDTTGTLTAKIEKMAMAHRHAAHATEDMRQQAGRAATQVRDLGRAYDRAAADARQLARAATLAAMAARMTPAGGSQGGGGGFGAAMRGGFSGSWMGQLWGAGTSVAGAGASMAGTGAQAIGSASAAAGPYGTAAMAGAGMASFIAAAPFVTGAIGGGMLAGGGMGLAAAGAAGAYSNDPEAFHKRWTSIIGPLEARWKNSTKSWIQPAMGALDEFEGMLQGLPIEDVFANTSGYLTSLAKGGAGFGANLGGGLGSFLKDAKPVIDMLEVRLPKLGRDFGDMFRTIGMGSEGGAEALDDLLAGVGELAIAFGHIINGGQIIYKEFKDIARGARELEETTPGLERFRKAREKLLDKVMPGAGDGEFRQTGRVLRDTGAAAEDAAQSVAGFGVAIDSLRSKAAAAKDAQIGLAQGWLDLKKELTDGKRTLDLNTQAGIDNQKALASQLEMAERVRLQQIELTNDVDAANATYAANIERIRAMAYAAGFNKQQVDLLIESMTRADMNVTPTIEVVGVQSALNAVGRFQGALAAITRHITVGIGVNSGSGMSIINDWGANGAGEAVRLPTGSTVMTAGAGRAAMRDAVTSGALYGGGGAGVTRIEIVSDGGRHGDYLLDQLSTAVRARGGNVQVAVMGRA